MKFYLTLGIMLLFLAGCAGPTAYYAGDYGYRYHDHYWYPYTETEPYGQGYGWDSGDDGPPHWDHDHHGDMDAPGDGFRDSEPEQYHHAFREDHDGDSFGRTPNFDRDDGPRFDGHRDLDAGNFEPHARDSE